MMRRYAALSHRFVFAPPLEILIGTFMEENQDELKSRIHGRRVSFVCLKPCHFRRNRNLVFQYIAKMLFYEAEWSEAKTFETLDNATKIKPLSAVRVKQQVEGSTPPASSTIQPHHPPPTQGRRRAFGMERTRNKVMSITILLYRKSSSSLGDHCIQWW